MLRTPILAALAVSLVLPAWAQAPTCIPRQQAEAQMRQKYKETRQVVGLEARGGIVEWWQGENGNWTVTVTTPQMLTCLVASGTAGQLLLEPFGEPM